MMFSNEFVQGNIVLDSAFYPLFAYSPSLKVNYPDMREKNNTRPNFPGPDTQVSLFEKEKKSFIKPTKVSEEFFP